MAPPIGFKLSFVSEYGETPTYDGERITEIGVLPTISYNGAEFLGWYYENDTQAQVGDVLTADTTLYAKWKPNIVTIYEPRLHAIADAIRFKNNTSEEYQPKDMANAIKSLASSNATVATYTTSSSSSQTLLVNTLDFTPSEIFFVISSLSDIPSGDSAINYLLMFKYSISDGPFALGVRAVSTSLQISDISTRTTVELRPNGFFVSFEVPPVYLVPSVTYTYIAI